MKKIIFEFNDEKKITTPGFPKTSGSRKAKLGGGLSIDNKGTIRDKKGTAIPATDKKTVQALNLNPVGNNCFDDLKENFWWYMGLGSIAALTFAPIAVPIIKALSKGAGGTFNLLAHPPSTIRRWGSKVKKVNMGQFTGVLKKIPAAAFKWITFTAQYGLALNQMKSQGLLNKVVGAARTPIMFTKHMVLIAVFTSLGYNFIYKKWIRNGNDALLDEVDSDSFQKTFVLAELMIEFFIHFETAIDRVILMMNPDLERDCIITNTILTGIGLTFAAQIAAPGLGGGAQGFNFVKLSKIKSADELGEFVTAQRAIRVEKINKEIISELSSVAKTFGVSDEVLQSYYKALISSPDDALKIISKKGVMDPKKVKSFHSKSLKVFSKKKEEIIMALNKEILNNQGTAAKLIGKDTNMRTALRGFVNDTGGKVLELTRKLGFLNPNAGTAARQGTSLTNKTAGSLDDVTKVIANPNLASLSAGSIDEIAKSINATEKMLLNGKITPSEAVSFFHNTMRPGLQEVSKEIIKRSPGLSSVPNMSSKVENLASSLSTLNKNEDLLKTSIQALSPSGGSSVSWIDKLFKTKVWRSDQALVRQKDAISAVVEAKKQILKINSKISPKDLAAIEESVKKTQISLKNASGLINPAGTAYNKIIMQRVFISAVTVSVVTALAKEIFSEDTDDISTWQSDNLARNLAWSGWFPNPTAEDEYAKTIVRLIDRIISKPNVLRTVFDKHIFAKPDAFSENNIINVKTSGDFDVLGTVNKLRIEKSKNNNILSFLEQQLGADLQGEGEISLTPGDKSKAFREKWYPIIMSILVANSGIVDKMTIKIKRNDSFFRKNRTEKLLFLKKDVFVWEGREIEDNLSDWSGKFMSEVERKNLLKTDQDKNTKNLKEKKEMSEFDKNALASMVKEVLKENYGKGYNPYPYHSQVGIEEEEAPDFMQDWKDFELSLVRDETRETAITIAKILIKDLELFGDVMDLVGQNQSVATEILKSFRENEKV